MKSKSLKRDVMSFDKSAQSDSFEIYRSFLSKICQSKIECPFHARALGYIRARQWGRLLDLVGSPSTVYDGPSSYFSVTQLCYLVKKYPWSKDQISYLDPEQAALEKFQKSEWKCKRINERFRAYKRRSPHWEVLGRMRSYIAYVLGPFSLSSIYESCGFGPGANVGVHGKSTNLARKIGSDWSVSPAAFHYARAATKRCPPLFEFLCREDNRQVYSCDPELFNQQFEDYVSLVNYNKISFVPKTAKIHRTIAVEPLLNSFLQKGTDLCMRRRLRRVGIDLSDQGRNQAMARAGSMDQSTDGWVTIDLASASDSISRELVKYLLPEEWYQFLDAIRSHNYQIDGVTQQFEKFCSMGNGFCFPLETLLFVAAAKAVGAGAEHADFSVYGDDIIVRQKFAGPLLSILKVMGFEPNVEKTFLEGPFRESCGVDSWNGVDVRPFTLDFSFDSLSSYFKVLNLTSRNALSREYFKCIRSFLIERIPEPLRFWRPIIGNADTGLDCELDLFMGSRYAEFSCICHTWNWVELEATAIPDKNWVSHGKSDILLLSGALLGVDSKVPFTMRRETRTRVRLKHGSMAVSTWLPGDPLGFMPRGFSLALLRRKAG